MAFPSYTYTFTNGSTADATQVNQNYNDILNGVTDTTKDISVNALTAAGTIALNGNITLGSSSVKTLTINASLSSSIVLGATNTYDIGTATSGLRALYLAGTSTNTTKLVSAASASHTLTFPATQGAAGSKIQNDGSGNLSWVTYTEVTKTTTYAVISTDDVIFVSASADWTLTLPTAVGATGKQYIIKRTDNNPVNKVTIATTSAQTIDGAANRYLWTQYEAWVLVSDGANWSVIKHTTGTDRLGSATITFSSSGAAQAAVGTTTTNNITYERMGRYARIYIQLVQTVGGTTGNGATLITLPAGLTADTNIVPLNTNTTFDSAVVPGNVMGHMWTDNGSNIAWYTPALHSSTKLHFGGAGNSAGGLVWGDGGTASMGLANATLKACGWVDVPILNWDP